MYQTLKSKFAASSLVPSACCMFVTAQLNLKPTNKHWMKKLTTTSALTLAMTI